MTVCIHPRSIALWGGVLLVGLLVIGSLCCCSSGPVLKIRSQVFHGSDSGAGELKEGTLAFDRGDYPRAAAIFEVLSEDARDDVISRRALFGLAASRLMLAQTPDEYREAINLWECWSRQAPWKTDDEDPHMVTPFLEQMTHHNIAEIRLNKTDKVPPAARDGNSNNNIALYKNLLQSREKEIEQLKSKLDAREKEIRRLKHQITSLEEIHLKYQERKQEVSPP